MATGICKLTGELGEFVASHLIPKALTRPPVRGQSFIEAGNGSRPGRRWSSWYDKALVTQSGEAILARLDTWAIEELRKQKLVWSGWGPMLKLVTQRHTTMPDGSGGAHEVTVEEPGRLRLFFLSLLWRAAASTRRGFEEIQLPPDDLENLRTMLVSGDPSPLSFYPMTLTQLSTVGDAHNLAPRVLEESPYGEVPVFRFYFDGLVTHIYRSTNNPELLDRLGLTAVGKDKLLGVVTVPFETSRQRETMISLMVEAAEGWPNEFERLTRR